MPANIRELYHGISFQHQTDIATLPADVNFYFLSKVNSAAANVAYNNESDALDYGKGTEWPRQLFAAGIDVAIDFEKYASSEIFTFLAVFGCGFWTVEEPEPGYFHYEGRPLRAKEQGIQLAYTAYVEGIRVTGSDSFFDRAAIGLVVNSWSLECTAGPGRASNKVSFQLVGSGRIQSPSGVAFPHSPFTEHPLKLGNFYVGEAIPANDYVANKTLISLSVLYSNNIRLDQGYVAGGPRTGLNAAGYGLRDRLEIGDRTVEIKFVARLEKNSTEFQKLMSQVDVPVSVWLQGGLITPETGAHGMLLNFLSGRISAVVVGDDNGIVTVEASIVPVQVGDLDLFGMNVYTGLGTIGTPATPRPPADILTALPAPPTEPPPSDSSPLP